MSVFPLASRHLLIGSFAIVMIAIACGGSDDADAPAPTATPGQTPTVAASAVPNPTEEPTAAPAATTVPASTATEEPADSAPTTPTLPVGAQIATINASKDNTLYESASGDLSNGAGTSIFAGKNGRGESRRALLQFDLADSIPAGATIVSATIELLLDRTSSGESNASIHRVTADWGEGESDAGGEEGGGTSPTSQDATWIHTFFDSETWESPGGDFAAVPSAEAVLSGFGTVTIGSTDGLVSDVQSWLDDASGNFGWIVIGDESHGQTAKRFVSSQGENPDQRPRLVVGFLAGEPQAAPEPTPEATKEPAATQTPAPALPTAIAIPTAVPAPTVAPPAGLPEGVESVTITAVKDNTLYESTTGALSNGKGSSIFAGRTGSGDIRRGLVAFEVAGAIPANAIITGASLQMQMTRSIAGAVDVELRRAHADWGEGASDAAAQEGAGVQAESGDATWLHTQFDSQLWQNSGGDFAANASAVTSVAGEGLYVWESTDQLILDVDRAHKNPDDSFGWVILGDESRGSTAKRFASAQSPSADSRPQLTILYTLPVPPTPTATPEPTATPVGGSVSITATSDTTLYESGGGLLSNGSGLYLFAGNTRNGLTRRALVAFDISSIPFGSLITSVSLQMEMTKTTAGDTGVSVHRVLTGWGEGASDANSNEGRGTSAADGDATWLHNSFDSSFWSNTGGDYRGTQSAVKVVGGIGAYTWESTDQLVQDVQSWLNDPSENFGWALVGDESSSRTAKRFASRTFSDSDARPVITIEFTTP